MKGQQLPSVYRARLPLPDADVDSLLSVHGSVEQLREREMLQTLEGMDVTGDGRWLVGYEGALLLVWRTTQPAPMWRRKLDGRITAIACDMDGRRILIAEDTGALSQFDVNSGTLDKRWHHEDGVRLAGQALQSDAFVWCDQNDTILVHSAASNGRPWAVDADRAPERVFVDSTGRIVLVEDDKSVLLYKLPSRVPESVYRFGDIGAEVLDNDGGGHVVGARDHEVRVWNRSSTSVARSLRFPSTVRSFDIDNTIERIVTATADGTITIDWPYLGKRSEYYSYVPEPHSVRLRGDDVYAAGAENRATKFDRRGRQTAAYVDRTVPVVAARINTSEDRLIVGDDVGGTSVYDLATGTRLFRASDHAGSVSSVDCDALHVASGAHDGTWCVRSLSDGAPVARREMDGGPVQAVMLHQDLIIAGNKRGQIESCEAATGELLQRYEAHRGSVRGLAIHGQSLLTAGEDGMLCAFDLHQGDLLWVQRSAGEAGALRLMDEHIVTGAKDGVVRLWDVVSGALTATIAGNASWVRGLCCQAGKIAAIGIDGDVRVWDTATGDLLLSLALPPAHRWRSIHFNRRFTRLLAVGAEGVFRVFDPADGTEVGRGYHLLEGDAWAALRGNDLEWICGTDISMFETRTASGKPTQPIDVQARERIVREHTSRSHTMMAIGFAVPDHLAALAHPEAPTALSAPLLLPAGIRG